uniref:NADH dehydrogenase [ubiquinone] 1 beta subcomplex subunit 7 n=1 Tax=Phallusia mammillata TaxID=59560 RepID=A0A6F9DMX3_9ASCI|nr:NADH dehydrogenase [ubiquinone] 1 beta subcomplex subunit 7-like [Phallusia mammillata]
MGTSLSRSFHQEDEPMDKAEIYEKFKDTSRPVREMKCTTEEMDLANIPKANRDYCAHLYMDFMKCRRDWFPEMYRCSDLLHKYQHCTVHDIKHRMMDYERAKRLMAREKRRQSELIE